MNKDQLRAALDRLSLPPIRAARVLGVDQRTVRYWLSGERGIPPLVARVLALVEAGRITVEEIMEAGDE